MSPSSRIPLPTDERVCPARGWRFFTAQRIIVIAFGLVEAAGLGWVVAYTMLRDGAR